MTFDVMPWRSRELKTFATIEEAQKAALDEALAVMASEPSYSGIRICVMQGDEVVGHVEVGRSRFSTPRVAWSPPEYPTGELPRISAEEYSMVLEHRARFPIKVKK